MTVLGGQQGTMYIVKLMPLATIIFYTNVSFLALQESLEN